MAYKVALPREPNHRDGSNPRRTHSIGPTFRGQVIRAYPCGAVPGHGFPPSRATAGAAIERVQNTFWQISGSIIGQHLVWEGSVCAKIKPFWRFLCWPGRNRRNNGHENGADTSAATFMLGVICFLSPGVGAESIQDSFGGPQSARHYIFRGHDRPRVAELVVFLLLCFSSG
jgi:hypothetical protein